MMRAYALCHLGCCAMSRLGSLGKHVLNATHRARPACVHTHGSVWESGSSQQCCSACDAVMRFAGSRSRQCSTKSRSSSCASSQNSSSCTCSVTIEAMATASNLLATQSSGNQGGTPSTLLSAHRDGVRTATATREGKDGFWIETSKALSWTASVSAREHRMHKRTCMCGYSAAS